MDGVCVCVCMCASACVLCPGLTLCDQHKVAVQTLGLLATFEFWVVHNVEGILPIQVKHCPLQRLQLPLEKQLQLVFPYSNHSVVKIFILTRGRGKVVARVTLHCTAV